MKKLMVCFLMITLLLLSTGCDMSSLYSNDDKIASDTNSFNLNKADQTIEDQEYTGELEFEGMDTVWTYDAEQDIDIEVSYLLSVNEGIAKLVLINPKGKLETIVENKDNVIQEQMETVKLTLKKGKNRIKLIAAEQAQIDIKLKIDVGTLHTIGF